MPQYQFIHVSPRPGFLEEVMDEGSDYSKGVAREMALVQSAPAQAFKIGSLEGHLDLMKRNCAQAWSECDKARGECDRLRSLLLSIKRLAQTYEDPAKQLTNILNLAKQEEPRS